MRKKSLHSNTLGYIFVAPTMLILLLFIGYPMINGIVNAFRDIELTSGREITFIGLKNFSGLFEDPIFFTSVKNSFIFVFVSVIFHIVLGFCLALMMDREIIGRTFFRTISLMPWAMSGVAVALIWVWLYHPQFSPINDILLKLGIIDKHLIFIGDPKTAMVSVLIAHNWRTFPFAFIVILSGLQMIPKELYESAEIDGARGVPEVFPYYHSPDVRHYPYHSPPRYNVDLCVLRSALGYDQGRSGKFYPPYAHLCIRERISVL